MPSIPRRRTSRWAAVCAALLIISAAIPGGRAAAGSARSAFFLDGWTGITMPDVLGTVADDGTITGYFDDPSNLYVEAIGPGNTFYSMQVVVPVGQTVTTGTYTTGVNGAKIAVYSNQGNLCSSFPEPGSITIQEFTASNARATSLAASFSASCVTNPPVVQPAHGVVRINSTVPFDAIRVTPHDRTRASSHDFGTVPAGDVSDDWTALVENVGTDPMTIGSSVTGDSGFELSGGSCGGTVAPGSSCTVGVHFAPSTGGHHNGAVHLLTPDLSITDRSWAISGIGSAPTTTTLSVDTDSIHPELPGAARYVISVSPVEATATGVVMLEVVCGDQHLGPYPSGAERWLDTPAGQCTANASFDFADGWLPSQSGPVTFMMPTRSQVLIDVATEDMVVEGATLTLSADALLANGGAPSSGTLTLIDETTGETLASGPVSSDTHHVETARSDLGPGVHHLVATYSGGGEIVGSSSERDMDVVDDAYLPDAQLSAPEFTVEPIVLLQTIASDLPVDIVTTKRLSNDGVHWATMPYTPSEQWSIIDPATGGEDADGLHTIYAQYRDRAGNWSLVVTDTVVLDRGLPVASAAGQAPGAGTALLSTGLPVAVSWTGSDSLSGVDHYVLQRSVDGGAWSVLTKSVPTTSKTVGAAGTHSYRYRVVAVDKAGNAKTGAAGSAVTVSARGDTSSSITYSGRWATAKSTAYTGGVTHYATASGAKATFKFTGRGFSWIASKGPTRGSAKIYVNGVYVKTVGLYAATTAHQRLAFTKTWSTEGTRTITIQVVGTSGHPRIDLDAIYSWQ